MRNIFIFSFFLFIGCGYKFQGSGSVLPPDVKTVAIPMVENETTAPGIGPKLTEAFRTRFDSYGILHVVDNVENADSILQAKVTKIESSIKNSTGKTDIALELQVTMTVAAELRRQNGQLLWANPQLRASSSYGSVSNVVVTSSSDFAQGGIGANTLGALGSREVARGQEQTALDDVIEEVARKLYIAAVAGDF